MKTLLRISLLLMLAIGPFAAAEDDVVMKAMRDELARSMQSLHLPDVDKPYFIAYRVDDSDTTIISATLGDLTVNDQERSRTLNIELRVGDYKLDNTNFLSLRGAGRFGRFFAGSGQLPLDNSYEQIRRAIWLATDAEYKRSAEQLSSKRAVFDSRKGNSDLPDFTKQDPVNISEPPANAKIDSAALQRLAKDVSAVFRGNPEVLKSEVRITARNLYSRYVNSEGSSYTDADPAASVTVSAESQAADGQPIKETFDMIVTSADGLHKDEIAARTKAMLERIKAMREAKSIERYNGPVLFEGVAAAQAFGQVFAPALVTTRIPTSDDPSFEQGIQQFLAQMGGGNLSDRLGGRVLPSDYDVVDKPREKKLGDVELLGYSQVDDEAVPTKDLVIVDKGILKSMLATRVPSSDSKGTTGSRHGIGASPTNLFLVAHKPQPDADLRKQMMDLVKQRGLDYGIVVRNLGAVGLSWVGRVGAMAGQFSNFNAGEVEVYKVYPDGKEELVRGVEFAPFLVAGFKDVLAAGDKPTVYTGPFIPAANVILAGMGDGSSSNGDPFTMVSYVAPSLLFEEVALKKSSGSAPNPPVVPSPVAVGK